MDFVIQIFCLLLLICLGIIIFQFFPRDFSVRKISLTAMFVLLSVVLAMISLMIPLFGFPSLKIGFSQLPLMLMGAFLGPLWAFIGGLCQDIISLILDPTNYPFAGFTLNKVIIALIPALWFTYGNRLSKRILLYMTEAIIVITYLASLLAIWSTQEVSSGGEVFELNLWMKLGLSSLVLILMGILCYGVYYFYNKYRETDRMLGQWIISVISVEVVVQYCMTPLWLNVMYHVPFMASLLVRLLKGSVMVFLNILLGLILYRLLRRMIDNKSGEENND